MLKSIGILTLALSLPVAAAELYRCALPGGEILYTDQECEGQGESLGKLPDPPPPQSNTPAPSEGGSTNIELNNNINIDTEPEIADEPVRDDGPNGLPFHLFRRLERGMSEVEVIAIAGPPEREIVDAVNTDLGITDKSFYYVQEGYNANITRIRFRNGNVRSLERTQRRF